MLHFNHVSIQSRYHINFVPAVKIAFFTLPLISPAPWHIRCSKVPSHSQTLSHSILLRPCHTQAYPDGQTCLQTNTMVTQYNLGCPGSKRMMAPRPDMSPFV